MTIEEKFNMLIPTANALTKYTKYYSVQCFDAKIPTDEVYMNDNDLYKIAISFIQLNMLMLKENIIENKGALNYESKI